MTDPPHRPRRSLGQNFLVDPNVRRKIVGALGAGPGDEVLEIGSGHGALTDLLAGSVRRLVAVELDDVLVARLRTRYIGRTDVTVVHGDFLAVDARALVERPEALRVVGSIPYNITTPIVFRLLERPRPADIVLMVQEEVADRLAASPGTSEYGALSVGVRSVAAVERLFRVGRNAFRPVPKVDSAAVRIVPIRPPPLSAGEEERLRSLVRAAFQWRRKQLGTILARHPALALERVGAEDVAAALGLALERRPETLAPADFVRLAAALPETGPDRTLDL